MNTGHGGQARRTIQAVPTPAWIEFAGAARVAQARDPQRTLKLLQAA
ncbi:hypothetical protein [Streptomyces sp. NPDC006012]